MAGLKMGGGGLGAWDGGDGDTWFLYVFVGKPAGITLYKLSRVEGNIPSFFFFLCREKESEKAKNSPCLVYPSSIPSHSSSLLPSSSSS